MGDFKRFLFLKLNKKFQYFLYVLISGWNETDGLLESSKNKSNKEDRSTDKV